MLLAAYQSFENSTSGHLEVTRLPAFVSVGLLLLIAAVIYTAMRNRKHVAESDVKMCVGCATPNPKHAGFCRKCGKKLG